MAYTSSIDELNNLQTKQDKQKIRDYFEEMDLEPEEIEKRIETANGLNNLYLILFLLMSASIAAGDSVVDDNDYWNDFLTRGYDDVLGANGYDTADPMISNRINENVAEVLNTTYEHIANNYYLSHDRAVMIASNDTNAFANYEQHIQAIKAGYTRKRWITMNDKKVRHSHVLADGQEVDIKKPFIVGGYEMLFPLDQSLDADAKEVINCRCVVRYIDKTEKTENLTDNLQAESLKNSEKYSNIATQEESRQDLNLQLFATPKERFDMYSDGWGKASLSETIRKFDASVNESLSTPAKTVYLSKDGSVVIDYDNFANYFRIHKAGSVKLTDYYDKNGNVIPLNYTDEKGKQHGLPKSERQRLTHFVDEDKL